MPPVTDMASLIARLEQASEGSRELDYAVFGALEGKVVPAGWATYADYEMPSVMRAPTYTTSIDAALTLVEDGREWHVGRLPFAVRYEARVVAKHNLEFATAPTPALALTIAALKARNTRTQEGN